jgi:hypothetical protein
LKISVLVLKSEFMNSASIDVLNNLRILAINFLSDLSIEGNLRGRIAEIMCKVEIRI